MSDPLKIMTEPVSESPLEPGDAAYHLQYQRPFIKGRSSYTQGSDFSAGDYIRENANTYPPMEAEEESILFITHHGTCRFLNQDGTNRLTSDIAFFKAQMQQ